MIYETSDEDLFESTFLISRVGHVFEYFKIFIVVFAQICVCLLIYLCSTNNELRQNTMTMYLFIIHSSLKPSYRDI